MFDVQKPLGVVKSVQCKSDLPCINMLKLTATLLVVSVAAVSAQRNGEQRDPCEERSRLARDAEYCDRYRECDGGQSYVVDCPNGLVYAGKNRGVADNCDYHWRISSCVDKPRANTPISTEHCDWLYGIFGHETSCTRYWTCWNGTATEQFCIGGLLYNEETHGCDWPQNVKGCQKHPLCKDDANGKVPLGKSCERYWSCQGGYPRLQRCSATLVFDKQSRSCVSPPTEDCEAPTTQAPPPEQEPDNRRPPSRPRPSQSRRRPQESQQRRTQPTQQRRPVEEDEPRPAPQSFRPRPQENEFQPRPQEAPQSFQTFPQATFEVNDRQVEEESSAPQPLRPTIQRRPPQPLNPVPQRRPSQSLNSVPQRRPSNSRPRVTLRNNPNRSPNRSPFPGPVIPPGATPIIGRPARPNNNN